MSSIKERLLAAKNSEAMRYPPESLDLVSKWKNSLQPKPIPTGSKVPDSSLFDIANNTEIKLSKLHSNQPLFITFFNGLWCDIEVDYFKYLHDNRDQITSAGVKFAIITPQLPDQVASFRSGVDVYVDRNGSLVKQLGIAHPINTPELVQAFKELGCNLDELYGKGNRFWINPTDLLVDQNGKVLHVSSCMHQVDRLDIENIVEYVKKNVQVA